MKRFHVNVTVDDLEQSVRFYSTLFAAEPTVALDKSWRRENLRAVVFLQEHESRRVVGASSLKLF